MTLDTWGGGEGRGIVLHTNQYLRSSKILSSKEAAKYIHTHICCYIIFTLCFQALQQAISDHEPEFVSLKREAQKLCKGPDAESALFDKVSLERDGSPVGCTLPRPGQKEQEETLADYERRLEALRNKLSEKTSDLNSQLEKGKEFESLTSELSSWLDSIEDKLGDFGIKDPKSAAIKSQQGQCKVCTSVHGTTHVLVCEVTLYHLDDR